MSDPVPQRVPFEEYAKTFRARVFGAVAILFAGVVLVFFSGCFMIGVLVVVQPNMDTNFGSPLGPRKETLLYVLYAMSGACFVSGMLLIGKGFGYTSKAISERP